VNLKLSKNGVWIWSYLWHESSYVVQAPKKCRCDTEQMWMWLKTNVDVIQKKSALWKYDIVSIRNTGHCILCTQTKKMVCKNDIEKKKSCKFDIGSVRHTSHFILCKQQNTMMCRFDIQKIKKFQLWQWFYVWHESYFFVTRGKITLCYIITSIITSVIYMTYYH